jgi:hypothetical protein
MGVIFWECTPVGASMPYADDRIMVFNDEGTQYAYFDEGDRTWTRVYSLSEFGGGGCPFNKISAIMPYADDRIVLFNAEADQYVYFDEGDRNWTRVYSMSEFGGGGYPFAHSSPTSTAPVPDSQLPTISPNLSIHIPSAEYQSLGGTMNLWVDLQFISNPDGKLMWELSNYGVNQ